VGVQAIVAAELTTEDVGRVLEQLRAVAQRAVHWAQAEAIRSAAVDIEADPHAIGVWARVFDRMAKRRADEHPEFAAVYEAAAKACRDELADQATELRADELDEGEADEPDKTTAAGTEQKASEASTGQQDSRLGLRASGVAW